jgi:hypothetical protein
MFGILTPSATLENLPPSTKLNGENYLLETKMENSDSIALG